MTEDTHEYQLAGDLQRINAADLTLEAGDTVELPEEEATMINDSRDEPTLELVDGDDGDGGEA